MNCQIHANRLIHSKCQNCNKFICSLCTSQHHGKNHLVTTLVELSQSTQDKINNELDKIENRIKQLSSLGDYEMGEVVIQSCQHEIVEYIKNLFSQMKIEYRRICDEYWQTENRHILLELEEKRQNLIGWSKMIGQKKQKVQAFQQQHIMGQNRLPTQQDLLDSSHSYLHNNTPTTPKIQFNQIALRRAHESLSKVIFISRAQTSSNPSFLKPIKSLKRSPSRKSNRSSGNIQVSQYQSLCKFIQGTSIMYQYILNDPSIDQFEPSLKKIEFREFTTPMRSVSITEGNSIFLIGGHNKEKKASKQIWMYQRNFNTMRIIGLLREARVGHSVCANTDILYIFGGSSSQSLEQFDIKNKNGKILSQYTKKTLIGSNIVCIRQKVYIIGGLHACQANNEILIFDLINQNWESVRPYNASSYSIPICPLLCPIGDQDILVLGGYYMSGGQSYNNLYCCSFNMNRKYFSLIGKGQFIYPILSSSQSCLVKNGKLYLLAQLKKQRNKHGPNLPALVTYILKQDLLSLHPLNI